MKYLLIFVLGFALNSALRGYYSYIWWSAEAKVTNDQINESYEKYGYPKAIYDGIGVQDNIKYVLITPNYNFRKWGFQFP